jgi:hypothetical protein
LLTLGAIAYFTEQWRGSRGEDKAPRYALLPGDIKYESPSGNFRFYFPITTSIVLSIVVKLVLRLFSKRFTGDARSLLSLRRQQQSRPLPLKLALQHRPDALGRHSQLDAICPRLELIWGDKHRTCAEA